MPTTKHHFITGVFYYTAAPLLRNALTFLTLPVLTRHLLPEDYGTMNLITAVSMFGAILAAGVTNSSIRFYFKYKDNGDILGSMLFSNLLFMILGSLLYTCFLTVFFGLINDQVFHGGMSLSWLMVATAQYLLVYINATNQTVLQNMHESRGWFANEAVATISYVLLSLGLVIGTDLTWQALLIAGAASETLKTFVSFFRVQHLYRRIFSLELLKESLLYCWPQIPSSIMAFFYQYFDKFAINRFKGIQQVGILDMSNRFGLILKMAIDGIGGALSPATMDLLTSNTGETKAKLADLQLKVIAVVLMLGLGLILISKELIMMLTVPAYYEAIRVIPLYIYCHIFGALGLISYWLIYHDPTKTFYQIPINAIGLLLSTAANVVLIPRFGLMGAAFAMFLSMGILQFAQLVIGFRLTPLPLDKRKTAILFTLMFAETGFLYYIYRLNISHTSEIIVKGIMFAIFPAACVLMRIIEKNDLSFAYNLAADKFKRQITV